MTFDPQRETLAAEAALTNDQVQTAVKEYLQHRGYTVHELSFRLPAGDAVISASQVTCRAKVSIAQAGSTTRGS